MILFLDHDNVFLIRKYGIYEISMITFFQSEAYFIKEISYTLNLEVDWWDFLHQVPKVTWSIKCQHKKYMRIQQLLIQKEKVSWKVRTLFCFLKLRSISSLIWLLLILLIDLTMLRLPFAIISRSSRSVNQIWDKCFTFTLFLELIMSSKNWVKYTQIFDLFSLDISNLHRDTWSIDIIRYDLQIPNGQLMG